MIQRNQEYINEVAELELILVNDSPEESLSMEDIKGTYDFKIQILCNEQNRGIHYSRVHGLKAATGEFVTFLDQDDVIADDFLKSQLEHMGKKDDVIVANGIAEYASYNKRLYRYAFMQLTVKHIWFYTKFDCRIISPGQCLIRKSSIPETWMKNIMTKNGADDYFLWLLMLSQGKRFGINRGLLYTHKYTSVNVSEDKDKMHQSVEEMLSFIGTEIGNGHSNNIKKRMYDGDRNTIWSKMVRIVEKINRN